ncbi:hypothetical protein Sa4125_25280 [Aureimonas sp. SA4125]|uniref:hypothetical protein n=1 Tax=Aureimonas sp. SA4125 TaxID=2826993 RepID=UPI001CC4C9D1|nr:hypothetical protein [Aureimonas sp. SA4125]BDA84986.1 hypothetical protein Sa4125_25280 [Aureimonas sp. SA4125]
MAFFRTTVAGFLGGSLALAVFAAIATGSVCAPTDGFISCSREWIGALSGYFAAAGAGLAAWYTIGPLRNQVREAKRQSDFIVGDHPPTLDAVRHFEEPDSIVLTVINWNRRGLIIYAAEIAGYENETYIWTSKINGIDQNHFRITAKSPAYLKGWICRNESPPLMKLRLSARDKKGRNIERWDADQQVRITLRLIGEDHMGKMYQPTKFTKAVVFSKGA